MDQGIRNSRLTFVLYPHFTGHLMWSDPQHEQIMESLKTRYIIVLLVMLRKKNLATIENDGTELYPGVITKEELASGYEDIHILQPAISSQTSVTYRSNLQKHLRLAANDQAFTIFKPVILRGTYLLPTINVIDRTATQVYLRYLEGEIDQIDFDS